MVARECIVRIIRPNIWRGKIPWSAPAKIKGSKTRQHGARHFTTFARSARQYDPIEVGVRDHAPVESSENKIGLLIEEDDSGEWDSIALLEASRRKLDWRQYLRPEGDWDFESDLDHTSEESSNRLIQLHSADLELWEELFIYRLRNYGNQGGKAIWKHLQQAAETHRLRLWERPRLWGAVLKLAVESIDILGAFIIHCEEIATLTKDKPDYLYTEIMKHLLLNDIHAEPWHRALEFFHPPKSEVKTLFNAISDNPAALKQFQSFCFNITTFTGMYKHVIGRLVMKDRYGEAIEWHGLLLKHNDLPSNFDPIKNVLRHFAKVKSDHLVYKTALDLHEAGVPGGARWLRNPAFEQGTESHGNGETIDKAPNGPTLESELHGMSPKQLSDSFVAKLVATLFFSVETVLSGLSAIGMDTIGPLAFRSLLLRVACTDEETALVEPDHVFKAQTLLEDAQLKLDDSTFVRVMTQVAETGERSVLRSMIRSDQHPEVLEDVTLQESLLGHYIQRGSQADVERTLVILRVLRGESHDTAWSTQIANLQLSTAVHRNDATHAMQIAQDMMDGKRSFWASALKDVLFGLLFSPRTMNYRPKGYRELDMVTQFMIKLERCGHPVPMRIWQELFKRRGWQANLSELEHVVIWKFRWVTDPDFRLSRTAITAKSLDWKDYYHSWEQKMPLGVPYLRSLFGLDLFRRLMQAGFAKDAVQRAEKVQSGGNRVLAGSREDRVQALVSGNALWGLRLIKRLQLNGLSPETEDVRRACAAMLSNLFSPQMPAQGLARLIQRSRQADWLEYALAMERIWGDKLFQWKWDTASHTDSIKRLEYYRDTSVRRSALRARLLREARDQSQLPAGANLFMTPPASKVARESARWLRQLPPSDIDALLKSLLPELNPNRLQNDPLMGLDEAEKVDLLKARHVSWRANPDGGFSENSTKGLLPWTLGIKAKDRRSKTRARAFPRGQDRYPRASSDQKAPAQ